MSYPPPLTPTEQANVRAAILYLGARFGTWIGLARAVRMRTRTLRRIRAGRPVAR
jgi:hypothetical protein